jgi:hypothetical protein
MRMLAPDVGALVDYGLDGFGKEPGKYRVSSWLRPAAPRKFDPDDFLGEILFEACQEIKGERWEHCTREEATHLALSGICGAIAPVEACKVTGHISEHWSAEHVAELRKSALRRGLAHEMIF